MDDARNQNAFPGVCVVVPLHPKIKEPVLALLFLTRGDVNQPGLWTRFISSDHPVHVFSHPKEPRAAERGFLKGTAIGKRIPTRWATISGPRAMLLMLREALAVEEVTHFAFLSESCVPLKTYAEVRASLVADPRSRIPISGLSEMAPYHLDRWRNSVGIGQADWRTHSNWFLLDREAAECIMSEDMTSKFERVWGPDEHYFGTVLAMHRFDEARISKIDVTWVDWRRGSPAYFDRVDEEVVAELSSYPGFFARKFRVGSNIGDTSIYRSGLWAESLVAVSGPSATPPRSLDLHRS